MPQVLSHLPSNLLYLYIHNIYTHKYLYILPCHLRSVLFVLRLMPHFVSWIFLNLNALPELFIYSYDYTLHNFLVSHIPDWCCQLPTSPLQLQVWGVLTLSKTKAELPIIIHCAERANIEGLRVLSWERSACKVDPWLVTRNMDFRRVPTNP